jgi:hypothetical protein
MVFEEGGDSIRIYDGRYREILKHQDILWQWNVSSVKDRRFREMFSKTKNDAKPVLFNGRLAILVVTSRGDGVAVIDFDSRRLVYSRYLNGSVHSATVTPDSNLILADSKGYVRILSTSTGRTDQCRHSSPHGVVWDKAQSRVWVWGGAQMAAYKIYGSKDFPKISCGSREMFYGFKGGHDLTPMADGTSMMLGSAGSDLFFFESDLTMPGRRFAILQKFPNGKGIKSVSRNRETGEIIFVRNDRSNGFKFRSNVIRSLDGRTRIIEGKTAFYKARWFQKDCFSF